MQKLLTILACVTCAMLSCNFSQSFKTDLMTGLTTEGSGLRCDDVDITVDGKKMKSTTFQYGEKFYLNFRNIEGFEKTGKNTFPGMEIFVSNSKGDTVIYEKDLYKENPEGFDISPMVLNAHLICGGVVHSNDSYTFYAKVYDKKGKGTFTAHFKFKVVPDKNISIKKENVTYDEAYLFSKSREGALLDGKVGLNEKIYMLIEGMEGFTVENDSVYPEVNIKATDASGAIVLDDIDLLGNKGIAYAEFHYQLSPNIVFTNADIQNPITCVFTVKDKKGKARVSATRLVELVK